MKKLLLIIVAFISSSCLYSQDALLLYLSNSRLPFYFILKDITISHTETSQIIHVKDWNLDFPTLTSEIDSVIFTKTDTLHNARFVNLYCPDDNHPHAIDLGLPSGTKWACCNVGASSPEGYGGYYAWGETEEKSVYNDVTYKYSSGVDEDGDGWYDGEYDSSVWQHIGDDIAGTEYDVAHVKWGGTWRMQSGNQTGDLLFKCTWTWTKLNGVDGQLVTGPNGGKIFLPAAGFRSDDNLLYAGEIGLYWGDSWHDPEWVDGQTYFYFNSEEADVSGYKRSWGISVRPVYNEGYFEW